MRLGDPLELDEGTHCLVDAVAHGEQAVVAQDDGAIAWPMRDARSACRPRRSAPVDLFVVEDRVIFVEGAGLLRDRLDRANLAEEGVAARREVELGFRESDAVEILDGLKDGDRVIVLGQDGLSNGTPVSIVEEGARAISSSDSKADVDEVEKTSPDGTAIRPASFREGGPRNGAGGPRGGRGREGGRRGGRGFLTPEMLKDPEKLEAFKQRMRDRGRTDEEINERLDAIRKSGQ